MLGVVGVSAHAAANVLWTPRGGFLVTQECIATPLIPVYLAARLRLLDDVAAADPASLPRCRSSSALGIARLLVVALPDAWRRRCSSSMRSINCSSARWSCSSPRCGATAAGRARPRARRHRRGACCSSACSARSTRAWSPIRPRRPLADPQGAIALLPAFQVGLYLALWVAAFIAVGWTRFLAGLALLGLTQTAGLLALQILATHSGLTAHVRDVRGWAVAGPVLIFAAVVNLARAPR